MLEAADLLRAKAREEGATEREVFNASATWDWSIVYVTEDRKSVGNIDK